MCAGFYMMFNANSKNADGIQYAVTGVILYIVTWLISMLVRKTCRCPLCKAYSLIDGKSYKHEKAYRIRPLSYGSTACLNLMFTGRMRCQHCGTPFDMRKKNHRRK